MQDIGGQGGLPAKHVVPRHILDGLLPFAVFGVDEHADHSAVVRLLVGEQRVGAGEHGQLCSIACLIFFFPLIGRSLSADKHFCLPGNIDLLASCPCA